MKSETTNRLKTGTVKKLFRNQVAEHDIIGCRWILTWKPLDPEDVTPSQRPFKAIARLRDSSFLVSWIHNWIPYCETTLHLDVC